MVDLTKIKNIEDLKNKDEISREIKYQNENFSLEDFFKYNQDGAISIITPNETVTTYAIEDHGDCAEKILLLLYSDFKEYYFPEYLLSDEEYISWQRQTTKRGLVVIQYCTGCSSLAWFPKKINKYQQSELLKVEKTLIKLNRLPQFQGDNKLIVVSDDCPKELSSSFLPHTEQVFFKDIDNLTIKFDHTSKK